MEMSSSEEDTESTGQVYRRQGLEEQEGFINSIEIDWPWIIYTQEQTSKQRKKLLINVIRERQCNVQMDWSKEPGSPIATWRTSDGESHCSCYAGKTLKKCSFKFVLEWKTGKMAGPGKGPNE